MTDFGYKFEIEVPFPTADDAEVAFNTLSVDKEISVHTTREVSVDGALLRAAFTAKEAKHLRASLATFLDMVVLTAETMDRFAIEPA